MNQEWVYQVLFKTNATKICVTILKNRPFKEWLSNAEHDNVQLRVLELSRLTNYKCNVVYGPDETIHTAIEKACRGQDHGIEGLLQVMPEGDGVSQWYNFLFLAYLLYHTNK